MCEAIHGSTGRIAAVSDRDSIIALSGGAKRELLEKPNSQELDRLMENRKHYRYTPGETMIPATESSEKYHLGVASPILCQGDLIGSVMLLLEADAPALEEADQRLAQTVASFLGSQMEN
jgi:AbrB family transcriptional regulator (stage V sporulation protein T)